jgi:hypothetical protein
MQYMYDDLILQCVTSPICFQRDGRCSLMVIAKNLLLIINLTSITDLH